MPPYYGNNTASMLQAMQQYLNPQSLLPNSPLKPWQPLFPNSPLLPQPQQAGAQTMNQAAFQPQNSIGMIQGLLSRNAPPPPPATVFKSPLYQSLGGSAPDPPPPPDPGPAPDPTKFETLGERKPINTGLTGFLGDTLDSALGKGAGSSLLSGVVGMGGNLLGMSLGGMVQTAMSSLVDNEQEKKNKAMRDSAQIASDFIRSSKLNTNEMGQIGQAAALGAKHALNAQGPSAQGVYALNQAENSATQMLSGVQQSNNQAIQMAGRNLGNQRNQSMNMLAMAGGPASAATRATQAAGQAGADTLMGTNQQNAQTMQSAFANAANIRNAGNQSYMTDKQNQYANYVKPYMNQWHDNMSQVISAGQAGMAAQGQSFDQAQSFVQNPLKGLVKSIDATAQRDTWNRVYSGAPQTYWGESKPGQEAPPAPEWKPGEWQGPPPSVTPWGVGSQIGLDPFRPNINATGQPSFQGFGVGSIAPPNPFNPGLGTSMQQQPSPPPVPDPNDPNNPLNYWQGILGPTSLFGNFKGH